MRKGNCRVDVEDSDKRAAYFSALLKRLCTDLGPHPSGTSAFEEVTQIVHAELQTALPIVFRDRYLDFWHVLPRPQILYRGKPVAVEVAENCAGTSAAGFTGLIERVDGPVPYRIVDSATGAVTACIAIGEDVHAKRGYLVGDDVLSLPRFVIGLGEVPFVDLIAESRGEVQVRLQVVYAPEVPTYNVVGTLPGTSDDEILIMAHTDSIIMTEGANDNMATAIITLMLAHAFSATRPRKTLTFAFTGSEEYGLAGARHYARRRQIEGSADRLQFVVNSDSLTYGPNLWTTTHDAELMELVKTVHADLALGTEPIYEQAECWMNDAACFKGLNPRIRGLNFNSRGYQTLAANHTPLDDAGNVPHDCAETAFVILREVIGRLQEI